jgi:hypothetical protein
MGMLKKKHINQIVKERQVMHRAKAVAGTWGRLREDARGVPKLGTMFRNCHKSLLYKSLRFMVISGRF